MNQLVKDRGCIILCGGKSSRMGSPKAMLPFGDQTLLQRVITCVENVCPSIVVVAAKDQPLPDLPESVVVVRDSVEGQGPLEGIRVGLKALPQTTTVAYVTSCDVPFLKPSFVSIPLCGPLKNERLQKIEIINMFSISHETPLKKSVCFQ